MTGCLPVNTYLYYDLVKERLFSPEGAERRPDCLVCSSEGLLGMGDEPISDFVRSSSGTSTIPSPTTSRFS